MVTGRIRGDRISDMIDRRKKIEFELLKRQVSRVSIDRMIGQGCTLTAI